MSCLVIEDNPITGPALVKLLSDNGWNAKWATCANDARVRLQAFDPSLLVVDVNLSCSGTEGDPINCGNGLDIIREHGKGRRVIVLTGCADQDIEEIREEFPNIEVIRKPIDPIELIQIIGRGRKGVRKVKSSET